MNALLTQIIFAARDSEGGDAIWVQMLVLVVLAAFFGIFSLVKTRMGSPRLAGSETDEFNKEHSRLRSVQKPVGKTVKSLSSKKEKDLQSGMELLGLDFLLRIVESTDSGDDEKDVAIRKLNFKELLRRGELDQTDSKALKDYAVNKGNLYGKDIQCEAIKTLAERSSKKQK